MDFLDPKKQRRHTIQLFIGYALMAIALIIATTLMVYYAYGYSFGVSREAEVKQKGLVFVSSQPSGAEIYLNTKRNKSTNAKLNVEAGAYVLELKKKGYHNWKRTIQIGGSSVNHFVYPLLFPAELQPAPIVSYPETPSLSLQSPDRRWLLVQPAGQDGVFDLYDLNRSQETVAESIRVELPRNILTDGTDVRWELAEWSTNNRHVLVKRSFTADAQQKSEYILIDRDASAQSQNLTTVLGLSSQAVTLRDKKHDQYYVHDTSTKELHLRALDNPSENTVVLADVLMYKSYGRDMLLYATAKDADDGQANIMLKDGDNTYKIRAVGLSEVYALDIARYKDNWYVALGSQTESRVFVYKNPINDIKQRKDKRPRTAAALQIDGVTKISFSANTRFIAAQNGSDIALYDIEDTEAYRYKMPAPLEAPQTSANWMDGHRFTYVSNGVQQVFDYDKQNHRQLGAANAVLGSYFDRDYEYIYTFTPAADGQPGMALTATPLRTEADL